MTSETPKDPRPLSPAPPADAAEFIAAHGRPYDADSDTYQRDPLVVHGKHGKASAVYNAHAYHTKVPPDAIKPYIEHYTSPGDIVLDPFCGSGMTGVACLLTGRHALLSDLSTAAIHIAHNYCTPIDLGELEAAWAQIKAEVADEFAWLYGTTCDRCGGPATTQYTVWSDVLRCPRCQAEVVLWDAALVREDAGGKLAPPPSGLTEGTTDWRPPNPETAPPKRSRGGDSSARKAGDVLEEFECPNCTAALRKTTCQYHSTVPVLTVYDCDAACRPRRWERATSRAERLRIEEISQREPPYWVPDTPFEKTREMWRGVHRDQGITDVRHFWTPRNLWALSSLWSRASAIADDGLARALRFILTSSLLNTSKLYKFRGDRKGGILTSTLYVPAMNCERNVLLTAELKSADVLAMGKATRLPGCCSEAQVSVASATRLRMPDSTADYVFTDPPFGSNIFYADCSLLWEAWLGELTDEAQEAVWNKSRTPEEGGKTLDDYRVLMEQSFAEMHRVLKPGRWATVVFSNSDDRVWHAIQTAADKAGFAIAEAGSLDKLQRSFKGVRGVKGAEKVVTKDVVLNLLKPVSGITVVVGEAVEDRDEYVRETLHAYLGQLATSDGVQAEKRTTQALYDHVVTSLLAQRRQTTGFGLAFVQSVAQEWFKQVDGLWYRRGDRVRADAPSNLILDQTSAIMWLERRLGAAPATEAELIPDFNTASAGARIRGGLGQLLDDNFVLDPATRRWRLPSVPERDALNDAGAQRRRRRVMQVARGGGENMTGAELVELAQEAVRQELYAEASAILAQVHTPDLIEPDQERSALLRSVIEAHSKE